MAQTGNPNEPPAACVAVIQCEVAHERCTGVQCAAALADREDLFARYGDEVRYYVPFPCGGCPGRRVGRLAHQIKRIMTKRGVALEEIAVHLSSCMVFESGHYPPCPHLADIRTMLARKGFARVVDGTHLSPQAEQRRAEGLYPKRHGQGSGPAPASA